MDSRGIWIAGIEHRKDSGPLVPEIGKQTLAGGQVTEQLVQEALRGGEEPRPVSLP